MWYACKIARTVTGNDVPVAIVKAVERRDQATASCIYIKRTTSAATDHRHIQHRDGLRSCKAARDDRVYAIVVRFNTIASVGQIGEDAGGITPDEGIRIIIQAILRGCKIRLPVNGGSKSGTGLCGDAN